MPRLSGYNTYKPIIRMRMSDAQNAHPAHHCRDGSSKLSVARSRLTMRNQHLCLLPKGRERSHERPNLRPRSRRRANARRSDSHVKQSALARTVPIAYRRDSSAPSLIGAGPAPSFPSPSTTRERSAGAAHVTTGHLTKALACRCYRHARLPALHRGDF
jgi:hypothetical protein